MKSPIKITAAIPPATAARILNHRGIFNDMTGRLQPGFSARAWISDKKWGQTLIIDLKFS
jgi:hypothetical protein